MSQSSELPLSSSESIVKSELEIARTEVEGDVKELVEAMIDRPEQFTLKDSLIEYPEYNGVGEREIIRATTNDGIFVEASRTRLTDAEARDPNRVWTDYHLQIFFANYGEGCEIFLSEGLKGIVVADYSDPGKRQVRDAMSDVDDLNAIQTVIELFRESAGTDN